jgi:indole-3-glycerol phosphate synthase
MATGVPDILARIVEQKRAELRGKQSQEAALIEKAYTGVSLRRNFRAAVTARRSAVIAEIKKASPSKGRLSEDFRPVEQATAYERGGASALSVLTDAPFFEGSLSDLKAARSATNLPVLRKDFTLDDLDVLEGAAHGADAILLIAAILTREELARLRRLATAYDVASLVEVHNERELDRALESGADIIGVNNRDLHTFEVRLETSESLAKLIPDSAVRVTESGIRSRDDVRRLSESGFSVFLVGEHLMKSGDPESSLRALL